MSLYFPETGYVQGMAALAATLLSYFDEEHAFIMLVRLWLLRGLDRLYRSGFAGLMEALDDFEKEWLAGGEVAAKLVSCPHLMEYRSNC
jgi:GTPase-activating protein